MKKIDKYGGMKIVPLCFPFFSASINDQDLARSVVHILVQQELGVYSHRSVSLKLVIQISPAQMCTSGQQSHPHVNMSSLYLSHHICQGVYPMVLCAEAFWDSWESFLGNCGRSCPPFTGNCRKPFRELSALESLYLLSHCKGSKPLPGLQQSLYHKLGVSAWPPGPDVDHKEHHGIDLDPPSAAG